MTHVSVLKINLEALEHNFNFFKSKLKASTKFLGVVKAFGYGSDSVAVAKHLERIGTNYLAVAYAKEGVALRKAGIKLPILVLHPQPDQFALLIKNCLEPNLYNFKSLEVFVKVLSKNKLENYPIHIKFNTGLNRLGFVADDIPKIISILAANSSVKLASIFSHLAASEDLSEKAFTLSQINQFEQIANKVKKELGYTPMQHILNTSGVVNYSEAQFDMVRIGIGLYGFGNEEKTTNQLQSVVQLQSKISQIHTIKAGETVGYNRAFLSDKVIKTATIPVGHADGISRQQGNGVGYVYINNQKAFIVGNVCMDMLMVDVTAINCAEGDTVYIYKDQAHIEDLAAKQNTIPYELLTAISQRIERKVV
ncbi:MAG: alanine racemase [Flavobacteriaceae bacterium]|nr:alanine racemase [Flavobacteriaceae bacterium]